MQSPNAAIDRLILAINSGDLPSATALIVEDPTLANTKSTLGTFPLFQAALTGQRDFCEMLLANGARIKAKSGRCSAVHFAARSGSAELAKFLFDQGAPLKIRAKNDWTELHGSLDYAPRAASILIELGMDVTVMGKCFGRTYSPLHLAIMGGNSDLMRMPGGRRRIVEAILDRGADPNIFNSESEAPLHVACAKGQADIVGLLLDRGGRIELADDSGATPLFFAVNGANLATVRLLLDRSAKIKAKLPDSAKDFAGATPLMMAERQGHRFIERLLRQRGAGRVFAGSDAYTTLSRAQFYSAAEHGEVDDIRWILEDDPAEVHALRPMGFISVQPIVRAATYGHESVVKLLIECGALVNDPAAGTYTPLHSAAVQGHVGVVKLLIAAGANVNANAGKRPVLCEAAGSDYPEIVKALLDAGADPNIRDDNGKTPLASVCENILIQSRTAAYAIRELLLSRGASKYGK